ncbi:MAG: hypothetical protein ACREHG_09200 [Candidatus Saccharimonadales bacterium]
MSNDLKLWLARFGLAAFVILDLVLLGMIFKAGMEPTHTHLEVIIVLFVISIVLSFPLSLYYYYSKAKRWDSSAKDQNRIAIETLAKLGEQNRKKNEHND